MVLAMEVLDIERGGREREGEREREVEGRRRK